jgi:hypothetical protein
VAVTLAALHPFFSWRIEHTTNHPERQRRINKARHSSQNMLQLTMLQSTVLQPAAGSNVSKTLSASSTQLSLSVSATPVSALHGCAAPSCKHYKTVMAAGSPAGKSLGHYGHAGSSLCWLAAANAPELHSTQSTLHCAPSAHAAWSPEQLR